MEPDTYQTIDYATAAGIARITLNRPDAGNTFSWTMADELLDALEAVDADDGVRVLILAGTGKHFCTGMDVGGIEDSALANRPRIGGHIRDGGGQVTLRMLGLRKPIIAAVHGVSAGIGVTITLGADIRIASESARFTLPFSKLGLIPEACSTWLLPRIVGISQAIEWISTGRMFDAHEALAARMVNRVVQDEELLVQANEIATEIVTNTSALSVAMSRQLLWQMLGASSPWDAHALESDGLAWLVQRPDLREGTQSFLEKRHPQFTSKTTVDYPSHWPRWPDMTEPG